MKSWRIPFTLGRVVVTFYILLSSLYALLAYVPFTYQQVHKGGLLPALTAFGRWHHRIYWIVLAIACATLARDFRRPRTRIPALAFAAVTLCLGVLLQFYPVMAALRNEAISFVWAVVALVPLLWLSAIDIVGTCGDIRWAEYRKEDDWRILGAAWRTALFLSLVYCCIFYLRASVTWGPGERVTALLCTLLCHTLVFGVLFAALNFVRSAASLTPWPSSVEYTLCNVLTAGIGFTVLKSLVFHPISFEGRLANIYAAALAGSIIACIAGLGMRCWRQERGAVDGLTLALAPLALTRSGKRAINFVMLAALAGAAWALAVNTAVMDWNYMFQKLTACVVWMLTFACLHAMVPKKTALPDKRFTMLFCVAMTMTAYRLTAAAISPHPALGAAIEKYAGYDASFRLIRDALSAPPKNDGFYVFLSQNTNIPRSVPTAPVDVDPAGALTPGNGAKPNIFIIVIDSLRRDYIGAYNPRVAFTPAIDAFAKESVVFRNSFTRYGGTGLAEPSIWVGGMMLHKQYVTPFFPMNALAKLVEAEKYQCFISMDPILRTVVKPMPGLIELDEQRSGMDYRLASSLEDLEAALDRQGGKGGPYFSYTQPQDIHISVINREKAAAVDSGPYSGFYAPYASRLHHMDDSFGKFIRFLKARGLFDNSVIVLTADHGDSLGEDGRWGHAYTLVPEVVRIPFIVHLPKSAAGLAYDPQAVTFQSDLTPSLYYLLGHHPTMHQEFYGRPLFTEAAGEQQAWRRDTWLLAASYAAVYGILGENGRSLYVSDAVNYKDTFYTISDHGASESSLVGGSQKTSAEDLMHKRISEINSFYKFQPHP